MVDVTKCTGDKCATRNECYRFVADDGDWQSWQNPPEGNPLPCPDFYHIPKWHYAEESDRQ